MFAKGPYSEWSPSESHGASDREISPPAGGGIFRKYAITHTGWIVHGDILNDLGFGKKYRNNEYNKL